MRLTTSNAAVTTEKVIRGDTSLYRRYYHMPASKANPAASGATWVEPGANCLGGWRVTSATHTLDFYADVHSDWDGATDLTVSIRWSLYAAGSAGDTVDLRLQVFYAGAGDAVTKSQTVEVATTTTGTQYKQYVTTFTIDFDAASNVVEAGDHVSMILNLETDTSEIDDIVVHGGSFHYLTTHVGVESADV